MGRRFFRHGELHLAILVLLSGRWRTGYELMAELGDRFGPAYRPSPGSVYPAVKSLAAEGLLCAQRDADDRLRYSTTEAGRRAVEDRRAVIGDLEARTGVHLRDGDMVEAAIDRFGSRVRAAARHLDAEVLVSAIDRAADDVERLARQGPGTPGPDDRESADHG